MSGKQSELIYWDSGIFIAWLDAGDQRDPNDIRAIDEQARLFDEGKLQIATSVITRIEVLECFVRTDKYDLFEKFFERRSAHLIDVNAEIADIAHNIRSFYSKHTPGNTVAVPDAIHIATAIWYQCERLYTFDGADAARPEKQRKSRPLISLSGSIGGRYYMTIEKPELRMPQQERFWPEKSEKT